MTKQETLQPRKRRGPAPTGKGTPVQVRLQDEMLVLVDRYAASNPDAPSRPEAIRRIIRDWLIGHDLMPPESD